MNFVFSPEEFTALLVLSTAASFTPGPTPTLSTALAANQGMGSALKFIVAVPVGWGVLLVLLGFVAVLVRHASAQQTSIQWPADAACPELLDRPASGEPVRSCGRLGLAIRAAEAQ